MERDEGSVQVERGTQSAQAVRGAEQLVGGLAAPDREVVAVEIESAGC